MMTNDNQHIPQGYKPSPLGPIPEDWEVKRLGEVFTFKNGVNAGKDSYGEGVRFVNTMDVLNNEYITGKILRGRVAINEKTKNEFLVSFGDVLFNRTSETREEVGCSTVYLDNEDAVFGGFVIRAHDIDAIILNPRFKQYCFQPSYIRNQISALGNGAIRYNLGQEDLSKVNLLIPTKVEQEAIVSVISLWDTAIAKQTALIEQLTLRKRGLMQQLLTGKKRLKGFGEDWKTIELGDALSYIQPTKYLVVSENYNNTYNTPVLTAGKTFILGYTDETTGVFNDLPAIIFDDFTTESKYVTFPFKAKSSAMKILKAHNSNLYFMFCAMQMIKYSIGGHERHWISKFSHLTLKVPSLKEQNAIASVLVQSDKEIELANKKLAAMQEQKKGLMQVLLTGKRRIL